MVQKEQQQQRLDVLIDECRQRHPNFREASILRLAESLLSVELAAIGESEEYEGENERGWEIQYRRSKLGEKKSDPRYSHNKDRIDSLCDQILKDNPALRQRLALQQLETSDPNSVNYRSPSNHFRTPLHQSAYEGDLAKCKELVEKGASNDIKDSGGNTPYMLAVREEHIAIAVYLKGR